MELEQNRATLKKAILALPSYQAPEGLWNDIAQQLDEEASSSSFASVIDELPEYRPPAFVWENINQALEEPVSKPALKVLSSSFLTRAAAVLLIIAASYLGYTLFNTGNEAKVSYAESTIMENPVEIDFQEDEPMIRMVSQAFEESPVARQQSDYDRLLGELKELDQARQDVLDMMESYGEDSQMIKELADIERSRTDIVMKMARFI